MAKDTPKPTKKRKWKITPNDVYEYIDISVEYCCPDMEKSYQALPFQFDKLRGDKLLLRVQYVAKSGVDFIPIRFCPFCGEPIKIVQVKTTKNKEQKVEKIEYIEEEVS